MESEVPDWPDHVLPLQAAEFESIVSSPRVVAVHCWASWNVHDYDLARQIGETVNRFSGMVDFYSLGLEDVSNAPLITRWGILNVPAFVMYRRRDLLDTISMGSETVDEFLKRLEYRLAEATR